MTWATHVLQWTVQRVARPRGGANLIKPFSVRIVVATRLHEAGIASNRGSASCGEYVPGPCTHRPSHHEFVTPEVGGVTFGASLRWDR